MSAKLNKNSEADSSGAEPRFCSNCSQEVPELYCTKCGQSIKEIRVSFRVLIREFVGEFLDYDSKFLRTVLPLFFKPGLLTHAYLDGKRVRYVTPLRLYLLSSVLFFLTLAIVSGRNSSDFSIANSKANESQAPIVASEAPGPSSSNRGDARFTDARFDENTWFGRYVNESLDRQDRKIQEMGYDAFMQVLVREFLSSLPTALFLLMPVFALLLKFCYWRSAPLYIDHLIFAFHYHAFAYVLTSLLMISGSQSDVLLAFSILFGLLAYPIYLLLALKRVYAQKWLWTLLKFSIMSTIYFTFLAMFLLFFFILSALFLV